jgi:hypothetical protein
VPERQERFDRLERLARTQDWVVAVEQLYELGFTYKEILGLVARHYLHPVHRGVYAVGHRRLSRRGWLVAALLAGGQQSFLSHRTAAGIRGHCALNTWEINLSLLGDRRERQGLVVHRLSKPPHPNEVSLVNGLRASSVERILIEIAATESRAELDRIIDAVARKKRLDLVRLDATIARHPRARGLPNLRAAIADYRPRAFDKSGLEKVVADAIAADPEIPAPLRNQHVAAGGIRWELDFFWPELRVALEVDGDQYHLTPQDKEKDRLKDAKLMAAGITPLRITDVRWELDPVGALADLKAILRRVAA